MDRSGLEARWPRGCSRWSAQYLMRLLPAIAGEILSLTCMSGTGPHRRAARGPVLPAGRLLHRPLAAGGPRRDHACACRPCARRQRPLPRGRAVARRAARALRRHRTCRHWLRRAIEHHGVRVSLHPAGHVLGSAQVRLEHGGHVWVASRRLSQVAPATKPTCAPFEPVRCDCFITESTFGLPIYRWPKVSR